MRPARGARAAARLLEDPEEVAMSAAKSPNLRAGRQARPALTLAHAGGFTRDPAARRADDRPHGGHDRAEPTDHGWIADEDLDDDQRRALRELLTPRTGSGGRVDWPVGELGGADA